MVSCLLIDKFPLERGRISCLLDELGVVCHQIADLKAAIQFCQSNKPDVVMLEASALPEAKEFLRLVQRQNRSTGRPVVILYASETSMAAMGDSILSGASEFLVLPFDRDLLQFKLSQAGILVAKAA